jgi:PAS domain S-box-containing protein
MRGMRLALTTRFSRHDPARSEAVADSESRILKLEAITETALSHLELDVLLEELLDRIRGILDVETASILLLEGDVLVPTASKGFEEEVGVGIEIPMGKGFAGRVGATRKPVLLEDFETIQVVNPLVREKGLRSLLGVPLLHRGTLIGVFHVGTTTRRRFTPDDVVTVQLVADRVAMAIEQSRLYEAEREARGEAEAAQRRLEFLSEASRVLSSSLDYAITLEQLTELAVPEVADLVIVDVLDDDDALERVALAHVDPAKAEVIRELAGRFPPLAQDEFGPAAAIKTGKAQLVESISVEMLVRVAQDDEHLEAIRSLGLRSFMIVPLATRDRTFGAMTFIVSESERRYGADDLAFAQELGRRAAGAIDNARLFAHAEERGRAVLVLDHVGEGVCLVDRNGLVRLWNPAAEAITGIRAETILGRPPAEAIPGWAGIKEKVPVNEFPASHHLPETLPLDVGGREAWLLISGVRFPGGTVFAFHDVTQERSLRQLQTEFVATVSHELRTPLAAVYGAAMTLRHHRDALSDEDRDRLFSIVYDEADRLSHIVDDVLWASRLDAGRVEFAISSFEPELVASSVVNAARTHAPPEISFEVKTSTGVRPVAADQEKVRQVLGNLVDNAVKYSPDGGIVALRLESNGATIRFVVADEGIGIPATEQPRIFEKFYRLDPNQTRGVGGTGLGLYICRELVRRMNGRIWVDSEEGEGSTFYVELPVAEELSGAEVLAHIRA